MLSQLFTSPTLYLKISSQRLQALHCSNAEIFDQTPLLAVTMRGQHQVISAFGDAARQFQGQPGYQVSNPFAHPRLLLASYQQAEALIKQVINHWRRGLMLRPTVILQPKEKLEGGLTDLEIRALHELGYGSGARRVYLWQGRDLSRDEARQLAFPLSEGELLKP